MKVALASLSPLKIAACKKAFSKVSGFELVTYKAPSGVNEQPVDGETCEGAYNRIMATKDAIPDADLYVSIENGIFIEDGDYVDRAVVTIGRKTGLPETTFSDGVTFPKDAFEEAKKRGFEEWTVGKVLMEMGLVKDHADPHLCLTGKSRTDYIDDAMAAALTKLKL